MEQNEPLKILIQTLTELSARLVRLNERMDRFEQVVSALNTEQAVHGRQILQLFEQNSELSDTLVSGAPLPPPPNPEEGRVAAAEIGELNDLLRQEPPPEAA